MLLTIFGWISLALFAVMIVYCLWYRTAKREVHSSQIAWFLAVAATYVAGWLLLIPVNLVENNHVIVASVVISLQHAFQMFSLDADFAALAQHYAPVSRVLEIYASILYVVAPIFLITMILSLFQGMWAVLRLALGGKKGKVYYFTELNEASLLLASDCYKEEKEKGNRCRIVFFGVDTSDEMQMYKQRARQSRAICTNIELTEYARRSKGKLSEGSRIFVIGKDVSANMAVAVEVIELYREDKNVTIYVFDATEDGKAIMATVVGDRTNEQGEKVPMKAHVRRVDPVQSTVNEYFYHHPLKDFPVRELQDRVEMHFVVVGLGKYGRAILKVLCWYCQLPDVELNIHVFDKDVNSWDALAQECPEVMSLNGVRREGDAYHKLFFYEDVDVESIRFDNILLELPQISAYYVVTGDESLNVRTALHVRQVDTRKNPEGKPEIVTVVSNSSKADVLHDMALTNFKNQAYDIRFLGDLRKIYSYGQILHPELEELALEEHLKWVKREIADKQLGEEEAAERIDTNSRAFFRYDYFYKSSVSKIIRVHGRHGLGLTMLDKKPEERSEEERREYQKMEHNSWNEYMRTEGYVYGEKRNDLAKTHPLLIPFDELPLSEQLKDD